MNRAALHEGLRRMRFESVLGRHIGGEFTQGEAAEMLGINERTFRRWRDRFDEDGEAGLADRRLGRPSPRRAPMVEIERMLGLFRDKYADFTIKHFHEQLTKRHGYCLGYTVTKLHLHLAGLARPAVKRSAHRQKRPRRPIVGTMLHPDGSRFAWLEGQAQLDLIVTLDDATGAIYSMFLVEEEGTASTFRGLGEVVERHGLFCSLYTDRGSHYFFTPKAGEKVSKTQPTQLGRALAQLGIEHIAAYSPEALMLVASAASRLSNGARSGRFARLRTACPRSRGSLAPRRWRRPIRGCAPPTWPSTTPNSRSRRWRKVRPSCLTRLKRGARFCASSRNGSWPRTTRWRGVASAYRFRQAGCDPTS